MTSFTPLSAALGGAMIGLSAVLLLLINGRVAGISGILGGIAERRPGDLGWRLTFLLGLVLAPPLYAALGGALPAVTVTASTALLLVGGVVVGVGTRLSGGCTSGHGVCGMARLSPRSLVATIAFMAAGAATVFVARHLLGA
jgi:uncharacterized membrane protein YedE/YeeE